MLRKAVVPFADIDPAPTQAGYVVVEHVGVLELAPNDVEAFHDPDFTAFEVQEREDPDDEEYVYRVVARLKASG